LFNRHYSKGIVLFLFWLLALKKACWFVRVKNVSNLSTLSTDTAGQLDVLGHDGDTLGMDGTQVGILKQTD
jgi:hypothetical protein